MPPPYPVPHVPLAVALRQGVGDHDRIKASLADRIVLTDADGEPAVTLYLRCRHWPNGGEWYVKRHVDGRSLTGYAGGHRPRGGGVAGLSAEGIARALAALDRQQRTPPKPHRPAPTDRCPTCRTPVAPGRLAFLAREAEARAILDTLLQEGGRNVEVGAPRTPRSSGGHAP